MSNKYWYFCRSCETTQERCPHGCCRVCGSEDVWPLIEIGVEPGDMRCIDPRPLAFPIGGKKRVDVELPYRHVPRNLSYELTMLETEVGYVRRIT